MRTCEVVGDGQPATQLPAVSPGISTIALYFGICPVGDVLVGEQPPAV
ncbi:hypothetical protein [Cryobacterium sp. Sr8]|nr:hypothetical protein [Cryobacterium sp. Sr8]